jgi:hypothetical protein
VLHAETGDVSLVGAVDNLGSPAEDAIAVGSVEERANAIAVQDPAVYVAAASGKVYAIDQRSGNGALLARLPGDPTALAVEADSLWVALADGTVIEVALKRETLPTRGSQPAGQSTALGSMTNASTTVLST